MAFTKTNWDGQTAITETQLNRIEQGIADAHDNNITQTAGGSETAITLTGVELIDGFTKNFIVNADNGASATTVNGKPLYKPNTVEAPNLKAGKNVSIWYDQGGDCFFFKASAEGNATAEHVLAGDTFSNDDDTGIQGTMVDKTTQAGWTANVSRSGTEIRLTIPETGYYETSNYLKASDSDFSSGNIPNNKNIFGLQGSMKSYASWTDITPVFTSVAWTSAVVTRETVVGASYIPSGYTVGSIVKWIGSGGGIGYGLVTRISGTTSYIWWTTAGLPEGTQNIYFCEAGRYPSDVPDIGYSNWAYKKDVSVTVNKSSSGWTFMSQFDTTLPLGKFTLIMSSGSWYMGASGSTSTQIEMQFAYKDTPWTPIYYVGKVGRDTGGGGGVDGMMVIDVDHSSHTDVTLAYYTYGSYQWWTPQGGQDTRYVILMPRFVV